MSDTKKIRQELRDEGYLGICPKCFHGNDMDFNFHQNRTCAKCGTRFTVDADQSDRYKLLHGGMGYNENFSLENALARQAEITAKQKAAADAERAERQKKAEDEARAARLESFKQELKQAEARGKAKRYVEIDNPLLKDAQKRAENC